jgi:hypothetical protein
MLRIAPLLLAVASASALDLTWAETHAVDVRLLPQLTTGTDNVHFGQTRTNADDRVSGGVELQVIYNYFLSRNWGVCVGGAGFWREHGFEQPGYESYHAFGAGVRAGPVLRLDELEFSLPVGVDFGVGRFSLTTVPGADEMDNGPYLALSLALENHWTYENHWQAGFGVGVMWFQGESTARAPGFELDVEGDGFGFTGFLMLGRRF